MREVPDLIACEGCDALYRKLALRAQEIAHCPRCGTELDRDSGRQREHILPLTVASLIMFVIANLFPIVEIQLQGLSNRTTLLAAVLSLTTEGMSLVALLVLATTILFPLLQLLFLLYLLLSLARRRRPPGFGWLVRAMQSLRPWGMIEVFLLGVLVAVVKLSNMATVIPGVALWAFGVLTILLTAVVSFNPRHFWEIAYTEPSRKNS
ncbi:paraquat-inducible protein A [Collimonas sp.]|jgi:paraquat-inducible protein A|uniref:paraquat-inducible protein A n=1 Tax=Collimonas sp. TaxID=1963772 RepID=UPI0037C10AD9